MSRESPGPCVVCGAAARFLQSQTPRGRLVCAQHEYAPWSEVLSEITLLLHPDVLVHMSDARVRETAEEAWTLARDELCSAAPGPPTSEEGE